ncbi:hypothetical protein [Flavobacterium johnsoniae]|uniref:Fibronectin type-III domain-containing protein n=1 Tax=Flavobacterium johnsoniae TaxID=986 RepID=A0A1M5HI88_FLAJO|nr:hypothetical protein [Flavobacterium johnsoniae]SHG15679.1 hypothetical protein SAMN05444388_101873 [Flavobacterium johnsoniae]
MKKLKLLMMSCFILTFISCSNENNEENSVELAATKSTGSTQKILSEDCSSKTLIVSEDNQYNCFGLAFSLSETELKQQLDNAEIFEQFITSGIFVEDNSSNASKVIYWNNQSDFENNRVQGIDHAGILTDAGGNMVYSKQGLTGLYKNCINYYYLWENIEGKQPYTTFYKKYALNLELNPYETNPQRNIPFTLSVAHDASALLEASYSWEVAAADAAYLQIGSNGGSCTLKFSEYAPKRGYTITLKAKHQRGRIFNQISVPKELTKRVTINLQGDPTPLPVPLTASVTGSTYVTKTSIGSWVATASGGTAPYSYYWWLKRQQDPDSFYLQVGTGSNLYLSTNTSVKSTYYNLYVRVVDAAGQSFIAPMPQVIQSTGPLVPFDL